LPGVEKAASPSPGAPRRGRPRSEQARNAILEATLELLLEPGLHAMSMDEVAARAGVSKATIYRWWPSKEVLALDALAAEWEASVPAERWDTGSLRGDLVPRMRAWLGMLGERPLGRVTAGLVARAQSDPEFAKLYLERFFNPRRDAGRRVFLRAIERGDIPPDADVDLALDLLYGASSHRRMHGHAPVDDRFVHDAIEAVIAGLQHPGSERS
jgi:AcrR family transcriptional regulator